MSDVHSWVVFKNWCFSRIDGGCNCHHQKKVTALWPDCSHDISHSNLSSTQSMDSTILRTVLSRMALTLLHIIIYIFAGVKIIRACSVCIYKQTAKTVSREATDIGWHLPLWEHSALCHHEVTDDRYFPLCCWVTEPCPTLFDPMKHTRLLCPSSSPWVCSNSYPLIWWCHPTILSSVIPFSSCLQFFPASGSFPMSWLFASVG